MSKNVFSKTKEQLFGREGRARIDWVGPIALLLLGTIGILFIYSAQQYTGGNLWKRQAVWAVLGVGVYAFIGAIDYKIFLQKAHWIYLLGIGLLLLVESPLGYEDYGAKRWINLGVTRVQPAEGAKIATLIMVSSILARSRIDSIEASISVLAQVAVVSLIPLILIFLQPDLGSTLIFPVMVFTLLYISKLSDRFFLAAFALFVAGVSVVAFDTWGYYKHFKANDLDFLRDKGAYEEVSWLPLKDYQRNRILGFAAPDQVDPRGTEITYNLRQSLISVAGGGLTGKGWTEGTQARLGYLPQAVAHNDFIHSVIAEETGFLGSVLVIGLFGVVIGNGIRIAGKARDHFGMLLAVGVSAIFATHMFINIGMTIGITPITGLPLPLLSYGGSFMLSCCILQGLVQSVYRFRRDTS